MASLEREVRPHPVRSEMAVLVSQYGKAQTRCSRLIAEQAALIEALQVEQMRLRAELVIRTTTLQFERENRARLEALAPGLPRRVFLARQVEQLRGCLEALLRERTYWLWRAERREEPRPRPQPEEGAQGSPLAVPSPLVPPVETCCAGSVPPSSLESPEDGGDTFGQGLVEAELLICRTGCISHGDYWRVRDQCRRTGKPCILIDEHQAIHAMRQGEGIVIHACPVRSL